MQAVQCERAPWRATAALVALALVLASCGSHDNNGLGVALIDDLAELKAVRLLTVSPPDTSTDIQRTTARTGAGLIGTALVGSRPGFLSRAMYRFDRATLPGAGTFVDSATIELPYREGFGATPPLTMTLHRITGDWTETTPDSSVFPPFDAAVLATIDVPFPAAVIDTLRIPLGELVQAWVDDSTSNFGVALVPAADQDTEIEFNTRESGDPPRLIVYRTEAGETVTTELTPFTDAFLLETTVGFMPVVGTTGRLAIQRGISSRALMRFDFARFDPRVTINRAEVTLHVDAPASLTNGFAVGIQRVTAEAWGVDSTEVDPLIFGVTTVTTDMDSISISITGILDFLRDEPNRGFQLRALEERTDTDVLFFHGADTEVPGKEPSLRVWYTPGTSDGD